MEKIHASIDLSLRSTGITIMDEAQNLLDCRIVSNLELKNESLIIKNTNDIINFIKEYEDISSIFIEGLSFMGISNSKDLIYGNFWGLRCALHLTFIDKSVNIEIIPVTQWRKEVISKERQQELKETLGKYVIKKNKKGKEVKKFVMPVDWLKEECVRVLPENIRNVFEEYVKRCGFKKKSIYDLTDSFWLNKWSWNV